MKIISIISGRNYSQCKETIDNNGVICSGKARDIIDSLKELKANDIQFEISQAINYEI